MRTDGYIMSLDQGTTLSRCLIFDHSGKVVASGVRPVTQIYPQPGWVEQDPAQIWNSQCGVAAETLARYSIPAAAIRALGIANQRETTIVWDRRTGKPAYNAIVWQCQRTTDLCGELREAGHEHTVIGKTGLRIDPAFSGTKLKWILDNIPGAREHARSGDLLFGTVDSWLLWKLTGGAVHATDRTNASRTMLYNIHTLSWDEELLYLLDIPRAMLPEVRPSRHHFGIAEAGVFGAEIPVSGMAGDQQAALFGQLCWESGSAKNTYGVGCFLLLNTGKRPVRSRSGLLTTLTATADKTTGYALEGTVFSAGDMLAWLRDELGVMRSLQECDDLATSVTTNNQVYLIPGFIGLGAPYWSSRVRAAIFGMERSTGKAHIVRAALESIAYLTRDILLAMEQDTGSPVKVLKADGGASISTFLMQFQADILDREVIRPEQSESTAWGAALLAGLERGFWRDRDEIIDLSGDATLYSPHMSPEMRDRVVAGWRRAVDASLYWAKISTP